MWTPKLVTVLKKKKHERRSNYIDLYTFLRNNIYRKVIIIISRRQAAQQANGDAAERWCAKWASAGAAAGAAASPEG